MGAPEGATLVAGAGFNGIAHSGAPARRCSALHRRFSCALSANGWLPVNGNGSWFTRFANGAARAAGRPVTFVLAATTIVVWGVCGPLFGYSDTWQLVINTSTTIVTFLMVFLIQNTQNRDSEAMHVKLDEVIRALKGAHNALLDLEELDEATLDAIRNRYRRLAKKARDDIEAGGLDIGCEELADEEAAAASAETSRWRSSQP